MKEYSELKEDNVYSSELIKLLNESEKDVMNGRVKSIQDTFDDLKKELKKMI
jgi:hypothetical protein